MTDILILPVNTGIRRLPEEVLVHIEQKHGKNAAESLVAYEALSQLSLAFHLSKSNRRLPYVEYNANGKPFFPDYPSVSFSLSHTDGMAAAVMSDHEDVGIDIEKIDLQKLHSYRKIAESRFFAEEQKKLMGCQHSELEEIKLFLSMWTLKEAAAKVLQLSPISVNTCAFSLDFHVTTAIHDGRYVVSVVKKART